MKKSKRVLLAIAVTALGWVPAPAPAHGDLKLTICIPMYRGARCARRDDRPSYLYGQTIVVKGRTLRPHGGTVEIMRRKGKTPWKVVAERELDENHYRYEWHTTEDDIDQGTPYKFKVHLPRHDFTRTQKVYVLFRE